MSTEPEQSPSPPVGKSLNIDEPLCVPSIWPREEASSVPSEAFVRSGTWTFHKPWPEWGGW